MNNYSIDGLVSKYMEILGVEGPRPIVRLRSNLGARWLGRCTWSTRNPHTSTIEIQRSIVDDDDTLERVVAHEMVHHSNFLTNRVDPALLRFRIKPESHGSDFREGAAAVNNVMGDGYVTVESDKTYKITENKKEFYLLVSPIPRGKLGYAWAARLSPDGQKRVDEEVTKGARLVRTTDKRWLGSAKIKRFGGYNVPKDIESEQKLRALFEG